ncbi:hypothetical protein [Helicobacter salomonis]|uniref:hypothetical protein n=1 Tax=Helicobacter salomonis TaxID=56878 RepID=UPI000CF0AAA2|nr:hypothetical protein [Helicobacter salomonis]
MKGLQTAEFTIEREFAYTLEKRGGEWGVCVRGENGARVSSIEGHWMADVRWNAQSLAYHRACASFVCDGQKLCATLRPHSPDYYAFDFDESTADLHAYLNVWAQHCYVHSVVRIVVRDGKVLRGYACAFEINIDAARARCPLAGLEDNDRER